MKPELVLSDDFEAHNHRRDVHEYHNTKLFKYSDTE
jgi:hypothetical protein